jgi:hypothetical protein
VAIGGQETALFLTRGEGLARRLGLDRLLRARVLPLAVAPPFGVSVLDLPPRLPLPAQITVQVLPNIDVRDEFGADPDLDEAYGSIQARMQAALDELAEERDLPLVGSIGEPFGDGAGERRPSAGERGDGRPSEDDLTPAATDDGAIATAADEAAKPAWLPPSPRRTPRTATPRDERAEGARPGPAPKGDEVRPPEGDELVAELADPGAAEGAGAEVRVDEPWEGYASMRVREIAQRLRTASAETLTAVRLYEELHKGRRGVLSAVDRELGRR